MNPPGPTDPRTEPCRDFAEGLVDVFSELADLFGNPRSHGAIYGLLFGSPEPMTMEEILARLDLSKGSVSQGLRALEELGAVMRERCPGRRSHVYRARMELRVLVAGFVNQRLVPRLEESRTTLRGLADLLPAMNAEDASERDWRLERVTQWHDRAAQFLPLAQKILESASRLAPAGRKSANRSR